MLYVIETGPGGQVYSVTPCDDGIEEAIRFIAGQITHPEEDQAAAEDGIGELWNDACDLARIDEVPVYPLFCISRRPRARRFGLAAF